MDMKTTRNIRDLSRAERKARKRKLENTIPALPKDDDYSPKIKNNSTPGLDGQTQFSKKRKRDDETAMSIVRNKKVGIVANVTKRNPLEKPLQQHGGGGWKAEHFNDALALSEPTRLVKRMGIDKTSAETEELLTGISIPSEACHPLKEPQKKREAKSMAAEGAQVTASNPVTSVLGQETSEAGDERIWDWELNKNIRDKGEKQKGWIEHEVTGKVKAKEPRFIVFIGNLPFTATGESIRKHFAAVHPKSVRHLTKKHEPTKSRGCAFVEFEGYDHMKSCLKSFHHSLFDDGISAPRRINVELTAGGGGNKKNRHSKINEKNQKLNEERVRRMQEEDKAKLVKKDLASDHSDVHPSRRARVLEIS